MKLKLSLITLAVLGMVSVAHAEEAASDVTVTGHVDLVSKYILRGATKTYGTAPLGNAGADAPESKDPVLQWGVDASWANGFYLGYWGSQINYSYKHLGESYDSYMNSTAFPTDYQADKSIENDFYGGYVGKITDDLSYTVGLTGYYYINGKYANAFETKLGLAYGPFSAYAQTLLKDTVWGNKGDTYWTFNYSTPLPHDITLNASLGYYTYKKQGKFLGSTDPLTGADCGAFAVSACDSTGHVVSSAWRHFNIGISQPITKNVSWGLTAIFGGENRYGVKQKNDVVANLSYLF